MCELRNKFRYALALLVVCAAAGCVTTTQPMVQPAAQSAARSASEPPSSEGMYLQAHATGSIAAARDAWRTQVRQRCGRAEHEEDMVYEYSYEVLASEPRERMIVVREGYVRCKPAK